MLTRSSRRLALLVFVALPATLFAQRADPGLLSIDRIFNSADFRGQYLGSTSWLDDSTYTTVEAAPAGGANLVQVDAASGRKSVLVERRVAEAGRARESARTSRATPGRRTTGSCSSSRTPRASGARTRAATSGCSTSRRSACRSSAAPSAKPSTLQFAKFSPDGNRVAYVREHNLYVESLADGRITPLTSDGSVTHHQRHVRLGVRGRAEHARRVPLEPGRHAHRLLAARRKRSARLPAHQQHRLALLLREAGAVPQGRHDQFRRRASAW